MESTANCRTGNATLTLPFLLGLVHFLVDASSNFAIVSVLGRTSLEQTVPILVAYNALAFALEAPIGLLSDRFRAPAVLLWSGLLLAAGALVLDDDSTWAIVLLTGLGNASFHVGAGVIASRATEGRASGPGIFIGPGAVGVVLGALAGREWQGARWGIFAALVASALACARLPSRADSTERAQTPVPRGATGVLLLLLFAVASRSLLGGRVAGDLGRHLGWSLPFAVAACMGKAVGGVLSDRFGDKRTAIMSLAASAGFLLVAKRSPWLAAAGVLSFQVVTSITLTALYRVLPNRIGLSFGLACLAIFCGGLPLLLHLDRVVAFLGHAFDAGLALGSALAIWLSLTRLDAFTPPRKTGSARETLGQSLPTQPAG